MSLLLQYHSPLTRYSRHIAHSIRNYMSKPWFLKMALEAEPSPLAKQISSILSQSPSTVSTDVDRLANGIAERTKPDLDDRPDAPDEVSKAKI